MKSTFLRLKDAVMGLLKDAVMGLPEPAHDALRADKGYDAHAVRADLA